MKYEKRHYAYSPTLGGSSIPADRLINELESQDVNYIGTFSKFNPIGYEDGLSVVVVKDFGASINQQKDFKLDGFRLKRGLSYHGSNFNNNNSISFSKQDLLRIANEMDDTNELWISNPDSINVDQFKEDVGKVCNIKM